MSPFFYVNCCYHTVIIMRTVISVSRNANFPSDSNSLDGMARFSGVDLNPGIEYSTIAVQILSAKNVEESGN